MPLYELFGITRVGETHVRPFLKDTLQNIMCRGGIVHQVKNLQIRELPYRLRIRNTFLSNLYGAEVTKHNKIATTPTPFSIDNKNNSTLEIEARSTEINSDANSVDESDASNISDVSLKVARMRFTDDLPTRSMRGDFIHDATGVKDEVNNFLSGSAAVANELEEAAKRHALAGNTAAATIAFAAAERARVDAITAGGRTKNIVRWATRGQFFTISFFSVPEEPRRLQSELKLDPRLLRSAIIRIGHKIPDICGIYPQYQRASGLFEQLKERRRLTLMLSDVHKPRKELLHYIEVGQKIAKQSHERMQHPQHSGAISRLLANNEWNDKRMLNAIEKTWTENEIETYPGTENEWRVYMEKFAPKPSL